MFGHPFEKHRAQDRGEALECATERTTPRTPTTPPLPPPNVARLMWMHLLHAMGEMHHCTPQPPTAESALAKILPSSIFKPQHPELTHDVHILPSLCLNWDCPVWYQVKGWGQNIRVWKCPCSFMIILFWLLLWCCFAYRIFQKSERPSSIKISFIFKHLGGRHVGPRLWGVQQISSSLGKSLIYYAWCHDAKHFCFLYPTWWKFL